MSKLQNRNKPLLIQLMNGNQTNLDTLQQNTLAAWTAMTVMCAEFRHPKNVAIAFSDRKFVMERSVPPENWKIWIGKFNRERWMRWQVHHHFLACPDNTTPKTVGGKAVPIDVINGCPRFYNTQTMAIIFEKLYILAYSSDVPDIFKNLVFRSGTTPVLLQLWPLLADNIPWPPAVSMTDRDAQYAARYIFETLTGVVTAY